MLRAQLRVQFSHTDLPNSTLLRALHSLVKLSGQVVEGVRHVSVVRIVLVVCLYTRVDAVERSHILSPSLRSTVKSSVSSHLQQKHQRK